MADALGIVASIAALSSSVSKQLSYFRDVAVTWRSADRASSELLSELHNLKLILDQIAQLGNAGGFLEQQGDNSRTNILRSVTGCQEVLQELDAKHQKYTHGSKGITRFKAIASPIRQRDLERLVKSLHGYQKELQLLMTIQLLQTSSRISSQLRGQTTPIDIPRSLSFTPQESADKGVLDWLTNYDYESRYHELLRIRAPHTGSWFLKSNELKCWLSGVPISGSKARLTNVLWCYGVPGSGKSVLMASAAEHILSQVREKTLGLAYFFFDYKTKASPRDVISCLLRQLCVIQRCVPRSLQRLYGRYGVTELSNSYETLKGRKGPETGELFSALIDAASEFQKTYFLIDGLDECFPEFQSGLLEVIRRIMKSRCRLLVAGRATDDFSNLFHGHPTMQIWAASSDIKAYVELVLAKHPELREMVDKNLENRIAKCLSEKAHGLFLFVYLSMQTLLEQTSVSELKFALEEIPDSLDDVYNGILQRIRAQTSSRSRLAVRIFMWLSFCERPLSIPELQHALAIDPIHDTEDLDIERLPPPRFIQDVCMDLVSVENDRKLVLLAHASLSQYLGNLKQSLFPHGTRDVAYSMLNYLHYKEFSSGPCDDSSTLQDRLDRYPLASYVGRHFGDHVRDYWQGRVPKGIMLFLDNPLKRMAFVQIMYTSSSQGTDTTREYPKNVSGLHLAAYFGLDTAAELILQDDSGEACAKMIDSWERTPLHWACERCRSPAIVEALLAKGTPVNALDHEGRAAIHLAARVGNVEVVLELLSKGANAACIDSSQKSAFDYAAAENHPKVITELLRRSPDGLFSESNALLAAAKAGHSGIVELLLDYGVEHKEVEALLKAAELGFEETVKLLVERGTDLNSKGSDEETALHCAAAAGRTSMVRMLLANGSKVGARDKKGRTALFLAAERGDEATLKVLTDFGAEIEARNGEGKTALYECAEKGNVAGVDFLLRRGATVSSSTSSDSTVSGEIQENALQIAARNGHTAVVRLLLEKYPHDQGSSNRTTLSYAAEAGQRDVARLLLDVGVDVNDADDDNVRRTALTYALEEGQLDLAKLLLRAGAGINTPPTLSGRIPLFYAIRGGHTEAVQLMLDNGANINQPDNSQVSPLLYAVQKGHAPVVKLLLEHGADQNATDAQGRNVSYYALESRNDQIQAVLHNSAYGLPRSSTYDSHRDPDTHLGNLHVTSRTSTSRGEIFRSQSETGPRPRPMQLYNAPVSDRLLDYVPAKYVSQKRIEGFLREAFPKMDDFKLTLKGDRWTFVVPRKLDEDEKWDLMDSEECT